MVLQIAHPARDLFQGPSINDLHTILGLSDPLPTYHCLYHETYQNYQQVLGSPLSAGVIYGWSLIANCVTLMAVRVDWTGVSRRLVFGGRGVAAASWCRTASPLITF